MELVLAGAVGRRDGAPLGDGCDRCRHRDPVAGRVRRLRGRQAFLPPARRTSPSRPCRSCRCSSASARWRASSRRRGGSPLELGGAVVAARSSLLRVVADTASGRLAALGDAARLGRGAAAVHRRRSRSCCCCRSRRPRCCSRSRPRIAAAARHRHRAASCARQRRAAGPPALLADRAGAAQRARQPDRLARQRRRIRVHRSAWSRRASRRPGLSKSMQTRDREARRPARS